MKKFLKVNIISILLVFGLSFIGGTAYSSVRASVERTKTLNMIKTASRVSNSDFDRWLELPEEVRKNTIAPRMVDVKPVDINKYVKTSGGYTYTNTDNISKFDYRTAIPSNSVVRNQGQMGSCWAFALTASLETTLAMKDRKNNHPNSTVYDLSEKHMDVATTRKLRTNPNNESEIYTNKYGVVKKLGDGGIEQVGLSYLTNGMGAIDESDMPYDEEYDKKTDYTENDVIKNTKTRVYDYVQFESVYPGGKTFSGAVTSNTNYTELMKKVKSHLYNYGGVVACTHGDDFKEGTYCNLNTGAIYINDPSVLPDHEIVIVGWDDDYSKTNFVSGRQPTNNGAWIVKNSWGDGKYSYQYLKEWAYNLYKNESQFIQAGYDSPSKIPDEYIDRWVAKNNEDNDWGLIKNDDNTGYYEILGDDGYFYISYEDFLVYSEMIGIIDAS